MQKRPKSLMASRASSIIHDAYAEVGRQNHLTNYQRSKQLKQKRQQRLNDLSFQLHKGRTIRLSGNMIVVQSSPEMFH